MLATGRRLPEPRWEDTPRIDPSFPGISGTLRDREGFGCRKLGRLHATSKNPDRTKGGRKAEGVLWVEWP